MKQQLKNLAEDYGNLPSILSLAVAVCAGYFFQSRYVAEAVGDLAAARFISVLACVALAVMVKGLMHQVRRNEKLDRFIEKYAKPAVGLLLVIFAWFIDGMTANTGIQHAQTAGIAKKISGSVETAGIADLRAERAKDQTTLAELDITAAKFGAFAYAQRRLELTKSISEKTRLIAAAEAGNARTIQQANALLIGGASHATGVNSALWGFYLMALVFGLEMFAPIAAATATAKITTFQETDRTEVSRQRVITQSVQHVAVKPPEPKTWLEACDLIEAGEIDWSSRKVAKMFPGISRYRVEQRLATSSHLPAEQDMENE